MRGNGYHMTTLANEPPNTRAQRRAQHKRANKRALAAFGLVLVATVGTVGLRSLATEASNTPKPDITNTTIPTLPIGTPEQRASLPTQTQHELTQCEASGLNCQVEPKPKSTGWKPEVTGSTTTTSPKTATVTPVAPSPDIPRGVAEGGSAHNGDFPTEIPSTTTSTIPSGGSTHTECGGMVC